VQLNVEAFSDDFLYSNELLWILSEIQPTSTGGCGFLGSFTLILLVPLAHLR
jgi:hypothetical protein